MWWLILVLGCLQLQTKICATEDYLPDWMLYSVPSASPISEDGNLLLRRQLIRRYNPSRRDTEPPRTLDTFPEAYRRFPETKRAFTLLSQWSPFSKYGRDTPSIGEHNYKTLNELDVETRARTRPIGQPLRWG